MEKSKHNIPSVSKASYNCGIPKLHSGILAIREYLKSKVKSQMISLGDTNYTNRDIYKQSFLDMIRNEINDEENRHVFLSSHKNLPIYYSNNYEKLVTMVDELFIDFDEKYKLELSKLTKKQRKMYILETVDMFITDTVVEKAKYNLFDLKKKSLGYVEYNREKVDMD